MFKLILTLNLLFIPVALKAQPEILWTKTYGGSSYEELWALKELPDGGFIMTGFTKSFGVSARDFWVVRVNETGDSLWTVVHGGAGFDMGRDVIQTLDNGYIVLGATTSFGAGNWDTYIIKLDSAGNIEWTQAYGSENWDAAGSILQTDDGSYIFSGFYGGISPTNNNLWIVKIDSAGDILWSKLFGDSTNSYFGWYIKQIDGGGYVIAGRKNSDVFLSRIDLDGDTLWTKTYGGSARDIAKDMDVTSDGGFIIVGYTESLGSGKDDVWLVKTDSIGDTLWTKTYGGVENDQGRSVEKTSDGGYIISGFSFGQMWLLRTDSNGDTLWTMKTNFRGATAFSATQTSDGWYAVAGLVSLSNPNTDGILMKIIVTPYAIIGTDLVWQDLDADGYAEGIFDGTESYNAEGYEVISYEWRLNGSLIGTDPIVTYILPTGIHTVTLTVTDENGYTGTKVKEITVAAYKTKLVEGISSILTSSGDSIFFGYTESNVIHKFNSLGEPEWNIQLNNKIQSALTSGNNGVLYAATEDSGIYAFNQAGDLLFSVSVGRINNISPALSTDGTLYIGNLAGALYSINSDDGSINWIENIGMVLLFSPVVSKDGTIYVNGPDKNLLAMNLDGSEKWRFDPGSWIFSSPALDGSGNLYFGSNNHNLYKLSPLGDEIWSVELSSPVWGAPVLGVNGSVYVESSDGIVHALSASGAPLWRYNTGNKPERISPGNPVVLSDGRIALFNSDNTLLLLDQDGNVDWSFKSDGALTQPPLITENGLISFASSDDYLYGLVPPDYVAGNLSSWHTYQGNNQRTGYQGTIVSVKDNKTETLPREYSLEQNYPNPFNPVTQINYSLPRAVHVSLSIYDLRGQLVVNLVDETHPAGEYSLLFDAAELSSGIYFYRITTDDFIKTKKMVILK